MARANKVIQKPKPPTVKRVALIDPDSGLISGYASGTNIVLGNVESERNWKDITDVPGSATLDSDKIRRIFMKDGKIKRKPRIRLIIDSRRIEIGRGRAKVSYEVLEGEVDELNLIVHSNGNRRKDKIRKNQDLHIGGNSRQRVVVSIDDPLIFLEGPLLVIEVVPSGELIQPPTPTPNVDDDTIIEKKDKHNG